MKSIPKHSAKFFWRYTSYLAAFILLLAAQSEAGAKDFCQKSPLTKTELIICDDPQLIWGDRSLNALFRLARVMAPEAKAAVEDVQRHWLSDTRDRCGNKACLVAAYQSRNAELRDYVNAIAEPFPASSVWSKSSAPEPNPNHCRDSFNVDIARQKNGAMVGVWEASTFCATFDNGGMVDIHEDGKLLDVRILGGARPSFHAGVALLAYKGKQLFIANLFERSSIGAEGDSEFFVDSVLHGSPSLKSSFVSEFGSATLSDLESAWRDTEAVAREGGVCDPSQSIAVCIRRQHP